MNAFREGYSDIDDSKNMIYPFLRPAKRIRISHNSSFLICPQQKYDILAKNIKKVVDGHFHSRSISNQRKKVQNTKYNRQLLVVNDHRVKKVEDKKYFLLLIRAPFQLSLVSCIMHISLKNYDSGCLYVSLVT